MSQFIIIFGGTPSSGDGSSEYQDPIIGSEREVIRNVVMNLATILNQRRPEEDDGRKPASRTAIESMESVKIENSEHDCCAICLENFEVGGDGKMTPCKHVFHPGCIDRWFGIHGSCPVCRFSVAEEEEEEEVISDEEFDTVRREIHISIYGSHRNGVNDDDDWS